MTTITLHEPDLRQPFHVEQLPLLARLHRWGFRSGCSSTPGLFRFLSRAAFYAGRSCSPWPHHGRIDVVFADGWRSAKFDARNRMFCALYFEAFHGGFEPPVTAAIDRFMPDDGVMYDIGCNWGYHSIHLATRPGFGGQIHAFEPWPSTFRSLNSVVAQLELADVIHCYNFAVGEHPHEGTMECGTNCGCARLVEQGTGAKVPVRPLDELELPPPDVIKVDTEGHEEQVFRGAVNLLTEHRPLLVFEHRLHEILAPAQRTASLEFLQSLGYCIFLPHWDNGSQSGLSLTPVAVEERERYSNIPDLLACHQDRLPMLEDLLCQQPPLAT